MEIKISVPEVVSIFKAIQQSPEKIFEMLRVDLRESVGRYLSEMMNVELSHRKNHLCHGGEQCQ